jgi:uncharacterized protein YecE (DUF72 family)
MHGRDPSAKPALAVPVHTGRGAVYTGTCSWTRGFEGWYPPRLRASSAGRLAYYARRFPAVEIDATYYALLPPEHALLLAQRTPPGFLFGVKAFALFTGHPADTDRLPQFVRSLLPADLAAARRLTARDLPEDAASSCWVRRGGAEGVGRQGQERCCLYRLVGVGGFRR